MKHTRHWVALGMMRVVLGEFAVGACGQITERELRDWVVQKITDAIAGLSTFSMSCQDLAKLGATVLTYDLNGTTSFDVMDAAILLFLLALAQLDQERPLFPGLNSLKVQSLVEAQLPNRGGEPALLLIGCVPAIDLGGALLHEHIQRLEAVRDLQAYTKLREDSEAVARQGLLQALQETPGPRLVDQPELLVAQG